MVKVDLRNQSHRVSFILILFALLSLLNFVGCSKKIEEEKNVSFEKQKRFVQSRANRLISYIWKRQSEFEEEFLKRLRQNNGVLNKTLEEERDRIYFRANKVFMQFFEDAIRADPTEVANYVSYGLYLRPRQGFFEEALRYIQKGPELEPDNPVYHFLLAYSYIAPMKSGIYTRGVGTERFSYRKYKDKFEIEMNRARKLMPENAFLDHFEALVKMFFEDDYERAWELIISGNNKPKSYFILPPPFPALMDYWEYSGLYGYAIGLESTFGIYPKDMVIYTITKLLERDDIKNDPEKLFELMRFLYNLSNTRPFDRIQHYLTGVVLEALIRHFEDIGDKEKVKELKNQMFFYDEITDSLGRWFEKRVKESYPIEDPKSFLEFEDKLARNPDVLIDALALNLRLLDQIRAVLGLDKEKYFLLNQKWDKV